MVNYRKNGKLRQTERRPYTRGFFPVQAECQTVYKEGKDCKRSNQDFFAKRRDWKPRRGYPYCGSAKERNRKRLAKAEAFCGENHRRKPHCKPARKSRRERDPSHFYKRARRRSATAGLLRFQEWSRLTAFKHIHILGNRVENLLAFHEIAAAVVYHDFDLVVL